MFCQTLKSGKVKYIENYKDPLTLKWKKMTITMDKDTAANRRLAMAALERKIDSATSLSQPHLTTLQSLYDNYTTYQEKTVKKSTSERNKRTLKKLIQVFGADSIVDNLTVSYINNKLLGMNCEAGTLNEYIRRFKAMLNWGYMNEYVQNRNLIDKLQYFKETKTKREKIEDKYLEPEEIAKLLDYMTDRKRWQWFYLTKFLILSGLRIGEAIALTSDDVGTHIHVDKTYDAVNNEITPPKTITSNRDVYVQKELELLIKQYRLYQKESDFEAGVRSNLFFHNKNGGYISYYAYEKYLRETSKKTLERKITVHALRHTHASLLLAEGVDIENISQRLGHENSRITKEIYLHVVEKLKSKYNQQLKDVKIL